MTAIETSHSAQSEPESVRTARCACGTLSITVTGEPLRIYACSCTECQRATGSVFSYRAKFKETAVQRVEGESRVWRRGSRSGRWVEHVFCPACGSLVYMRGEGLADAISIYVGCFVEPSFAAPAALFWASHRHEWFSLADGIGIIDAQ